MVQTAVRSYNYKEPRSINFVSIVMGLAVALAIYGGIKFVPHYWRRSKVDEALRQGVVEAGKIWAMNPGVQRQTGDEVVRATTARIEALGVSRAQNGLRVYFGPGYGTLHADYVVIVKHPVPESVVKPTTLTMRRSVAIDRASSF
jgi:hypothetical protein